LDTIRKNRTIVIGTTLDLTLAFSQSGQPLNVDGDALVLEVFNPATGTGVAKYRATTNGNQASWRVTATKTKNWPIGRLAYRVLYSSNGATYCPILGTLHVISGRDL
jgi:hypothetical protein